MKSPQQLPAPGHPAVPRGGVLRILYWLLLHPAAWRAHLFALDPDLKTDFCLVSLSPDQRRSPALRELTARMLVFPPTAALFATLLLALVRGYSPIYTQEQMLTTTMLAVGASLSMALIGSLGAGVVYGVALGVGIALAGFDLVSWIYLPSGLAAGLAGAALYHVIPRRTKSSSTRRLQTALVGLFAFWVTIVASIYGFSDTFSSNSSQRLLGEPISPLAGFLAAAGSIVLIAIESRLSLWMRLPGRRTSWALAALPGLACGIAMLTARLAPLNSFSIPLSAGLYIGLFLGSLACFFGLLGIKLGSTATGAIAAAFSSGTIWISAAPYTLAGFHFDPLAYLGAIVLILAGLTLPFWFPFAAFPLLAGWCGLLYRLDLRFFHDGRRPWLRLHPAFTLGRQPFAWPGIAEHLLLVTERSPLAALPRMSALLATPSRTAARAVMVELEARRLEHCAGIEQIAALYASPAAALSGEEGALLRRFEAVSRDTAAALRASGSSARVRLNDAARTLKGLEEDLLISSDPRQQRFSAVAVRWQGLVEAHARLLEAESGRSGFIENPYICGLPLDDRQEVFVGRVDLIRRIEHVLLERQAPPLVLYGQRRMGKTSLLLNLKRILNSSIAPAFVDCQGLAGLTTYDALLFSLMKACRSAVLELRGRELPALPDAAGGQDESAFLQFLAWMEESGRLLKENGLTLLLLLDEFEALETLFDSSGLDAAPFLNMFRHLLQHNPAIRLLMAGSHTPAELGRWSQYLVNAQLFKIGVLEPDDALRLVTRPVHGFPLRYDPGAAEHVLALTGRHPNLVQLLCYQLVDLKNTQPVERRFQVTVEDVEAAAPAALRSGAFFFADIERNQVPPGAAVLLRALARRGMGAEVTLASAAGLAPGDPGELLRALLRRDLLAPAPAGGYAIPIELLRRWFAADRPGDH